MAHCRTTRDTLVRADGSTAHEGVFDLETGHSCASRRIRAARRQRLGPRPGLALYGYSQVYALAGQDEFLEVAERNAGFWLANLPDDAFSVVGFSTPTCRSRCRGDRRKTARPRPSPPAACGISHGKPKAPIGPAPIAIRRSACSALAGPDYLADQTPGWEGILRHGVYHTAKNLGVDESVMWGEFFFVEALTKALSPAAVNLASSSRQ